MAQNRIPKRAYDEWQKRMIIERLFSAWVANPSQRLGQLIENALACRPVNAPHPDLFNIEDMDVGSAVIAYCELLKR